MLNTLSGLVVVGAGLFLVGLALMIIVRPRLAERFLASFASSARAHYTEQGLRLVAGLAMIRFAPLMWLPDLFRVFGWLIAITSAGLLLMPWQWHHKLAILVMPLLIRRQKVIAIGACTLGALILYGASRILTS
jgi:hypothetical protein